MFQLINKLLALPAIALLIVYQKTISPDNSFWSKRMGFRICRFHPTCSQYAILALRKYGFLKGTWLAAKRLSKCHPGNIGGNDPLP
ncbi:MAG: membrane protein insertion efficiency factor YidD [Candidatus Moranbacteria bacterium]|nr:membrane protein insertion efficiency factor YidD [Candidatus Moranbacteria bacterium]